MKYVVVIGDGMAGWKIPSLGNRTTLEAANKPSSDRMAREGVCGLVQVVSKKLYPGSDVSNMSILGYDPEIYYSGRSPLEAASIGVSLGEDDVAVRCNVVTIDGPPSSGVMVDYSAGHITTGESAELLKSLNERVGDGAVSFHPGVSYRNLMVWSGGHEDVVTVPPHDIMGRRVGEYLPQGQGGEFLIKVMGASHELFMDHEVNVNRKKEGKSPGTSVWLWGQGKAPTMPSFKEKFGLEGGIIAAVDLLRGLGIYLDMELIDVPGATGYLDTNFKGKGSYCLKGLERKDFLLVHIEAPDEAGHNGDEKAKIRAIEEIDRHVITPLIERADKSSDLRVMFLPDHPTPVEIRTHSNEPVPFVIYPAPGKRDSFKAKRYTEYEGGETGLFIEHGYELIDLLMED